MASYKITADAKANLKRIYQWGGREYGEAQADKYFDALFDRFNQIVAVL